MALDLPSAETVARALDEFPALRVISTAPLTGGLINQSFAVTAEDGAYVLQRVHPVFAPEVHENIAVVTERLRARGIPTTIRDTRGQDIDGACGQLAANTM